MKLLLLLLTDDTLRVDIFLVGHDYTPSDEKKKIFQCDFLPAVGGVEWRGASTEKIHGERCASGLYTVRCCFHFRGASGTWCTGGQP